VDQHAAPGRAEHAEDEGDGGGEQVVDPPLARSLAGPLVPQPTARPPPVEERGQPSPPDGEAQVVGAERDPLPAGEDLIEHRRRPCAARRPPDHGQAAPLGDELDRALDGGFEQPGDAVLGAGLLGQDDAALRRGHALGRGEVGGGHVGEVGLVDPRLDLPGLPRLPRWTRGCAESRVGGPARADQQPLTAGPPHQPQAHRPTDQAAGDSGQRRWQQADGGGSRPTAAASGRAISGGSAGAPSSAAPDGRSP
jgi:hypothetical protein